VPVYTLPQVENLNFEKSKMADGHPFNKIKIAISLQPFKLSRQNSARWCSASQHATKSWKVEL